MKKRLQFRKAPRELCAVLDKSVYSGDHRVQEIVQISDLSGDFTAGKVQPGSSRIGPAYMAGVPEESKLGTHWFHALCHFILNSWGQYPNLYHCYFLSFNSFQKPMP